MARYRHMPMDGPTKPPLYARAQEWFRTLGAAGPLTILATALPGIGGLVLLGSIAAIAPALREHLLIGLTAYVLGFCLLGGLALLPSYACSGLGGWAFGFAIGYPAAMAGLTGAAIVGYLISYRLAGQRVAQIIKGNPKAGAVYQALLCHGFAKALLVVSLIRIPPVPPFAATNVLMAASRVPLPVFILGTIIGIAPRTAFVAYFFSRARTLDFHSHGQLWLFGVELVVAGLILALLGHLAHRAVGQMGTRPRL